MEMLVIIVQLWPLWALIGFGLAVAFVLHADNKYGGYRGPRY